MARARCCRKDVMGGMINTRGGGPCTTVLSPVALLSGRIERNHLVDFLIKVVPHEDAGVERFEDSVRDEV